MKKVLNSVTIIFAIVASANGLAQETCSVPAKSDGGFKFGVKAGINLSNVYDEEGNKNAEENYKNGKKVGSWKIFYQNGKVSKEVNYKDDQLNGPYKEFFDSGTRKIEGVMVNGEFDGKVTIYHPNGKIWQTGTYTSGLKEGRWKLFKEDETLEKEEIYHKGDLKSPVVEQTHKGRAKEQSVLQTNPYLCPQIF